MEKKEGKNDMDQNKRRKRAQAFFMVAIVLVFWNLMDHMSSEDKTVVACVGDSITYGTGVENRKEYCYPVRLQQMLGTKEYQVGNFGVEGVTVQKKGNIPYVNETVYEKSLKYDADIVVMILGTNDSKKVNWKNTESFEKDYRELTENYEKLPQTPKLILATPPKVFEASAEWNEDTLMSDAVIQEECKIIKKIGEEKKIPVLDLYTLTENHPQWFREDSVHPNQKGAEQIAVAVAEEIKSMESSQ